MNTPAPLSRRETIASGILQALVSNCGHTDFGDDNIDNVIRLTDRVLAALDRTAPANLGPVSQPHPSLRMIAELMEGGEDILVGSTRYKSIKCWATGDLQPVSPAAALPLCPEHLPKPPEDCVYYGTGPLKVYAEQEWSDDVWILSADSDEPGWDQGSAGDSYHHYALRRGSPIARANGITD